MHLALITVLFILISILIKFKAVAVAQWQSFGFACQRSPDQSPKRAHILFLYFIISFQTFTGSNPGLEGHFSAVFSGYGTYGKSFSLKFGLECDRCQVEESGGNMLNFRKGCVLLNTKKGNFDFFKNGSFKIKNILTYHCTYVWYCSPTLIIFLTFFCDLIVSFEQCDQCLFKLETNGQFNKREKINTFTLYQKLNSIN